MRVLPQEIADILPNILADCPQPIVEKFQQELDKSKVPAPDTLKQLLSAAQRQVLMTSQDTSKLLDSKRCTDKLRGSLGEYGNCASGSQIKMNKSKGK